MPQITLNGTVTKHLATNQKFNPPSKTYNVNTLTDHVVWQVNNPTDIPPDLQSITISDILSKSNLYNPTFLFEISVNMSVNLECDCGLKSYTVQLFYRLNGLDLPLASSVYQTYTSPPSAPDCQCIENVSFVYLPPNTLKLTTQNLNKPPSITNFPLSLYLEVNGLGNNNNGNENIIGQLDYIVNVQISIDCTGSALTNSICKSYCNNNPNCVYAFADYCFSKGVDIATSNDCQSYIKNYIQTTGPIPLLDTKLTNYCSQYKTFYQFEQEPSVAKQEICACHLNELLYTKYYDEITATVPELADISGINKYCLFIPCEASPYKRTSIGKICKAPNCLNIVQFDPEGNIKNVSIKQSCFQESGSVIYKYIIFIFIAILIIIVFVLFLFTIKVKK